MTASLHTPPRSPAAALESLAAAILCVAIVAGPLALGGTLAATAAAARRLLVGVATILVVADVAGSVAFSSADRSQQIFNTARRHRDSAARLCSACPVRL